MEPKKGKGRKIENFYLGNYNEDNGNLLKPLLNHTPGFLLQSHAACG